MLNRLKVPATMDHFEESLGFIEERLRAAGIDERILTKVLTASEEIIVNIIQYAYQENEGDFMIEIEDHPDRTTLSFSDYGQPFDPLKKPDADTSLKAHEREIGGLGILMVKKLMDDVQYDFSDGRNTLTITKMKGS